MCPQRILLCLPFTSCLHSSSGTQAAGTEGLCGVALGDTAPVHAGFSKSLSSIGTDWAGGEGQFSLCPPLITPGFWRVCRGSQTGWRFGVQIRPSGQGWFLLSLVLPFLSEQFRAGLTLLDLFSQSTYSSGSGCRLVTGIAAVAA